MAPPKDTPKWLVVEGHDDRQSVLGLARSRLQWPENPDDSPVYIDTGDGADKMVQTEYLTGLLKMSRVRITGIMLDADTKLLARYQQIRSACLEFFPKLPEKMPASGLIVDNDERKRFGVWMMPDNVSAGDLEIFLTCLVPESSEPVWKYATDCVANARAAGAPYRDSHVSKANLYTWLAWQNPPGQSAGVAITKKTLDPHSPSATPFVNWFRELYELQGKAWDEHCNPD